MTFLKKINHLGFCGNESRRKEKWKEEGKEGRREGKVGGKEECVVVGIRYIPPRLRYLNVWAPVDEALW